VHLAEIPGSTLGGCGCATMSRNDPPHLAGLLDLLRLGRAPEINRVLAGDVMNERTLGRERLSEGERAELVAEARLALERMIAIVEGRA
jgi:quinolinate synthase